MIEKLPKIELHVHLEGSISWNHIHDLMTNSDSAEQARIQELLKFNSFPGFLKAYAAILNLIQREDEFYRMTKEVLENLSTQHVIYTELMFTPWFFTKRGMNQGKIMSAILKAIREVERDRGIQANLIFDGPRNFGKEAVREVFEMAARDSSGKVKGVGLGGDEKNFPAPQFKEEFQFATDSGLQTVAHAGEGCGEESIEQTLDTLNPVRLGHALGIKADSALEKNILEKNITLDLCPTSNLFTGSISKIEDHPVREYFDRGYQITINSDDPTFFKTTLSNELKLVRDQFGFNERELLKLQENAVEASLLEESEKNTLQDKLKLSI